MLSNTGGDDANNSSSGAVVVGKGKCAAEAQVYVGFAVSEVVPANCVHVDENTNTAEVGTTDESIGLEGGNDSNNSSLTGERGRRKMVRRWLVAAQNDGGGGDGARALLGQ